MRKPYVGVSGVTRKKEVDWALQSIPSDPSHDLMIGILASWKTVRSQMVKKEWQSQFPGVEKIKSLLSQDARAVNFIHYCPEEKRMDDAVEDLYGLYHKTGRRIHGFQINLKWPEKRIMRNIRHEIGNDVRIIQQVPPQVLNSMNPYELRDKVSHYEGIVDDFLLDPSAGEGKRINPDKIRRYLVELERSNLDVGLGIAGGLEPNPVDLIKELAVDFSDLSIDAQSNLRGEDDKIKRDLLGSYLESSFFAFKKLQPKDAFGEVLRDYHYGNKKAEFLVKRDDGYDGEPLTPERYFTSRQNWPEPEKEVIDYSCGKVLDLGAGAGKHSLYLQNEKGQEVTAVDTSPGAIEVMQDRGSGKC